MNTSSHSSSSQTLVAVCLPEELVLAAEEHNVEPGEVAEWVLRELGEQPEFFMEASNSLKIFLEEEGSRC